MHKVGCRWLPPLGQMAVCLVLLRVWTLGHQNGQSSLRSSALPPLPLLSLYMSHVASSLWPWHVLGCVAPLTPWAPPRHHRVWVGAMETLAESKGASSVLVSYSFVL